eukprot:5574687-Prymnesium_polylepis.2
MLSGWLWKDFVAQLMDVFQDWVRCRRSNRVGSIHTRRIHRPAFGHPRATTVRGRRRRADRLAIQLLGRHGRSHGDRHVPRRSVDVAAARAAKGDPTDIMALLW